MKKLTFRQLAEKLGQVEEQSTAAESHGTVSGFLCCRIGRGVEKGWIQKLFPGRDVTADEEQILQRLYAETRAGLGSEDFSFFPLLPDDSAPVGERISALGEWCQGFLMGLSLGGVQETALLTTEAQEVLHDLAEISQADSYQLDGGEEDERSYMELLEYTRTGVLLLYTELGGLQRQKARSTLH